MRELEQSAATRCCARPNASMWTRVRDRLNPGRGRRCRIHPTPLYVEAVVKTKGVDLSKAPPPTKYPLLGEQGSVHEPEFYRHRLPQGVPSAQ